MAQAEIRPGSAPIPPSETPEQIARRLRPGRVADQVLVVTGASSGIGRGISIGYAREDARGVVLVGRNTVALEETAHEVAKQGAGAVVVTADITDPEGRARIAKTAKDKFKRVNNLTNNAGLTRDGNFLKISEEDWDVVLNTNLKANFFVTQEVYPLFEPGGTLVVDGQRYRMTNASVTNIESVSGLYGITGQPNYAASKAGEGGLTRVLAVDMGRRGVRVNSIAPGLIDTPIIVPNIPEGTRPDIAKKIQESHEAFLVRVRQVLPSHRLGTPEDVAHMASYLASKEAEYVTGQTFVISGGIDHMIHALPFMVEDALHIKEQSAEIDRLKRENAILKGESPAPIEIDFD